MAPGSITAVADTAGAQLRHGPGLGGCSGVRGGPAAGALGRLGPASELRSRDELRGPARRRARLHASGPPWTR